MNPKKIGAKLKKLRGDIPLETVANAVGISRSALVMYERGERIPRDEIKIKLAKFFGVTIADLFFT